MLTTTTRGCRGSGSCQQGRYPELCDCYYRSYRAYSTKDRAGREITFIALSQEEALEICKRNRFSTDFTLKTKLN